MNWINKELYPFESNYYLTKYGNLHYIDEGEGEILLFVHGTPTWSFLYRNYIKDLSKKYRCIAIDHLGFGLSDKNSDFEGSPQKHNEILTEFINHLQLKKINLIVHDFGGVIALPYAIDNINNINKIIIFNTFLWSNEGNPEVIKIDKILKGFLGKFLYLNLNFSPKVLLKKAFYDKSKLNKEIHNQYLRPFPNKNSRIGLYRIALSLLGSSKWYESYWKKVETINKKKVMFIWGVKDEFIGEKYLEKWLNKVKAIKVLKYNCGHFVQEENFTESLNEIKLFLESEK